MTTTPPGGQQPYPGPPETGYPPAQGYGQFPGAPTYPQPGYGYPPGYPTAGYPPGYPVTGYPMAGGYPGYPAADPRARRPGPATAAAVLGYVNSGLLIIAGFLLLLGSSIIAGIESGLHSHTDYATEAFTDGVVNLVAAGLLIAGGVMITGRNATGRILLGVANGIVLAETVYWLVRWIPRADANGLIIWAVLFAGLAIVSLVLSWLTPVSAWLASRT